MEAATQGTGVQVVQTQDNQLKLEIPSDISFDTGRYDIKSNFAPILDRFAEGLRSSPNAEVRIVGHVFSECPSKMLATKNRGCARCGT